jgi:hypothetical protein
MAEFIDSTAFFTGSANFVLIVAQKILLVATVEPSSAGGLELNPVTLTPEYFVPI